MTDLYTFFELYKTTDKPIPNYIEIDGKKGFVYPGYALILEEKIYTIPIEIGTYETESVQWIVDSESVNVRFKV